MKTLLLALVLAVVCHAETPILKRSEVVFMYQANRQTYDAYGATVLAWGGRPSPKSLAEADGVKFFGSVGMVTEFARYHDRFPESYEEGLCRDVFGKPVKVPWLTDHQHKGIPYWWCCTQQPQFRQYLRERVADTLRAGAYGIHIDDHMGSAGGLWLGLCFCDRCVEGFKKHLASLPNAEIEQFGIEAPESYDFRAAVRAWMAADADAKRRPTQHPLWGQWTVYQCHAAAAFMEELHALASETAGRTVPMGANAGLLWPRHLSDYKTLDLFSAETDHHARERKTSDLPLFAYRMADAVARPYAATASGGDWAFIKEQNLPGLVRNWIALSYGAGHMFMAPHRQWCYTPEKGTHWYNGPEEQFAPLYRFVRKNPELFDLFESFADVAVLLPHRAFVRNPGRWFEIGQDLASANLAYRLILAGDEIVDLPLDEQLLFKSPLIVACDREDLLEQDRGLFDRRREEADVFSSGRDAVQSIHPAVRISSADVRVLPRTKPGGAAIHLLNRRYAPDTDQFQPISKLRVSIDRAALRLPTTASLSYFQPGAEPVRLKWEGDEVEVPVLRLWGILLVDVLDASAAPYPPSKVIAGIEWAPPATILRHAQGSDNWPITWADDGALYTAYGDGWGFEPRTEKKLSLGLAKITGDPPDIRGVNIRSATGEQVGDGAHGKKASGMLMVDGVLYMWTRNADNAQLAWSKDHGKTWTWADWRFTTSFGYPTFLNFGRNYAGARDDFVYMYSHDSDSAYEAADRIVLARVPKDRLTERQAYEFFTQLDAQGEPHWSQDIDRRGAVFSHPERCYRTGITYNAGLKRYLWCQVLPESTDGRGPRFQGGFGVYDAPEPWGPWTTVYFTNEWDVGPGETSSFPTKWMSEDGRTLHLVFSGDDHFSVRQARLMLNR